MFQNHSFGASSTNLNQLHGIDSVVPVKFSLTRSGTYQPQHRRSWETTATGHTLNRIVDSIGRLRQTSVNAGMIGALGGLMSLSSGSQGEISIPNQWDTCRGIFMLMLDFRMRDGNTIRYVIQGYTESPEFSEHFIDPNLVFYVNNSISYMFKTRMVSGIAQGTGLLMQSNYHPLQSFDNMGGGMKSSWGATNSPSAKTLIRPQDIVSNMANAGLRIEGVEVVEDFSTVLGGAGNEVQSSTRANAMGSTMAARLLNAYNSSHNAGSSNFDISTGDIADRAFNELVEQDAQNDLFLGMLNNHKNGVSAASFSYKQLESMVPGVGDSTIRTITINNGRGVQMHQKHDSMTFGKQSLSAVAAANLQVSLPSLMVECMLFSVSFTAVSNSPNMDVQFGAIVPQAFDQEMSIKQWHVFEHRFKTEILPLLRGPHKYPLDMIVNCQFNGEFLLKITVAEEEVLEFISPTFCDGLISPVITADEKAAMSLSSEMMTACEHISDQLLNNQQLASRGAIASVDKLSPDVSQFRQGDILSMPSLGRQPLASSELGLASGMNVRAAPSSTQMGVGIGIHTPTTNPQAGPSVVSGGGSLLSAFKN